MLLTTVLIRLLQLVFLAAILLFKMPIRKTVRLIDGNDVPIQVYGTNKPEDLTERIKMALEAGIRHFDCAERYHTEEAVGEGLKELGFDREKRDEIFVTTKCK
jgi:diketogulonate reductase-like aldo/keto reductase